MLSAWKFFRENRHPLWDKFLLAKPEEENAVLEEMKKAFVKAGGEL